MIGTLLKIRNKHILIYQIQICLLLFNFLFLQYSYCLKVGEQDLFIKCNSLFCFKKDICKPLLVLSNVYKSVNVNHLNSNNIYKPERFLFNQYTATYKGKKSWKPLLENWHTKMILSFRTVRPEQTVQTQIRLLLEKQSDQGLHCLPFLLHCLDSLLYSSSNFRVITTHFLGVWIFRKFTVTIYLDKVVQFSISNDLFFIWLHCLEMTTTEHTIGIFHLCCWLPRKLQRSPENIIQSEQNRIQSEQNRTQSEQNIIQSEKNIIQSEKNIIQSEKNIIQSEKNTKWKEYNTKWKEYNTKWTEYNTKWTELQKYLQTMLKVSDIYKLDDQWSCKGSPDTWSWYIF